MPISHKRRISDFDDIKSDSSDEDYDDAPFRVTGTRSHRRRYVPPKPRKRVRRDSYERDGNVVSDDGSMIESSIHSGRESESSGSDFSDSGPGEVNPKTGRRVRSAARKCISYQEISDDADSDPDEDSSSHSKSLVVKLSLPPNSRQSLKRNGLVGRAYATEINTRKSTRLAKGGAGDSLKSPVLRRNSISLESHSPERGKRPTQGGKGPEKVPSGFYSSKPRSEMDFHLEKPHLQPKNSCRSSDEGPLRRKTRSVGQRNQDLVSEDAPASNEFMSDTDCESSKPGAGGLDSQDIENDDNDDENEEDRVVTHRARLRKSHAHSKKKTDSDQNSDFAPTVDESNQESSSAESGQNDPTAGDQDCGTSVFGRRSRRLAAKSRASQQRNSDSDDHHLDLDPKELADELDDLVQSQGRSRRRQLSPKIVYERQPKLRKRDKKPDYRVFRPELWQQADDEHYNGPGLEHKARRNSRHLFSVAGPLGGSSGPLPLLADPQDHHHGLSYESDSSDDDGPKRSRSGFGVAAGVNLASGGGSMAFPSGAGECVQSGSGPAQFGKITDKKSLADTDPLGVDAEVTFDEIGGLNNHVNQLKEMVLLPLLYPEVFQQFGLTPPRGVLFHGPPGTGKTLMARAVASSVRVQDKRVTFYMRKGADALSKWVGEAERQLRRLFEDAKKNQPSIIFFDEIDGLAPVRSSKQEQIHASIVATLLALMDGMDGRGQVVVIGATNRPDNVDPALRRPGRFDREFYFPLPDERSRRKIIEIHTRKWQPPLAPEFKEQLARLTKGYGGADLRALCTEAALNAVQGTYPQIYKTNQKLRIDPSFIKVQAKDFMITVNRMVPSSERAGISSACPLPPEIAPLLSENLDIISRKINDMLSPKKQLTALEEAEFDDRDDGQGFEKELMEQAIDRTKVFRPRLLIHGPVGMGQNSLGPAILHKFENFYIQSFDLASLLEDSSISPDAAVVRFFRDVRRRKPSIVYIPHVDLWYDTVAPSVVKILASLLNSIMPNEPILLLGIMQWSGSKPDIDPRLQRDLFGFSCKSLYQIKSPGEAARREYFSKVAQYVRMSPNDFPQRGERKKRELPELEVVPVVEMPKVLNKEELKAQNKSDRHSLNLLKLQIQPVMDHIKRKYKKFRNPVIELSSLQYLFDEKDGSKTPDGTSVHNANPQDRPYELVQDSKGLPGLRATATGKFFYNLDTVIIETRLSNGYYKRPKDFLKDVERLEKDSINSGDADRIIKAKEMVSNVEVDMTFIERSNPALISECEAVLERERARERLNSLQRAEASKKKKEAARVEEKQTAVQIAGQTDENGPEHQEAGVASGMKVLNSVGETENGISCGMISDRNYDEPSSVIDSEAKVHSLTSLPLDQDVEMTDASDTIREAERPEARSNPPEDKPEWREAIDGRDQTLATGQALNSNVLSRGVDIEMDGVRGHKNRGCRSRVMAAKDLSGVIDDQRLSLKGERMNNHVGGSGNLPGGTMEFQEASIHYQGTKLEAGGQGGPGHPGEKPEGSILLEPERLLSFCETLNWQTRKLSIEQLQQVNAALTKEVWDHRDLWNRNELVKILESTLEAEIKDIKRAIEDEVRHEKARYQ